MRRLAVLIVLAFLACEPPTAPTSTQQMSRVSGGGSYIVVFKRAAPGLAKKLAGDGLKFTYGHAIHGFAADLSPQAAEAIRRNPNVAYIEQDARVQVDPLPAQSNAPWGLDRIDQRNLPLDGSYGVPGDGSGVTVYVIDTGIDYSHPDFGGRAVFGFDAAKGKSSTGLDCHGHGTHVAGIAGGRVYGVAKAVNLVAVRVLDCNGRGSWSDVIAGIDWVAAHAAHPAVANMSLAGLRSQSVNDATNALAASGVTVAVAAANEYGIACQYSPASAEAAITVGATDQSDTRAGFSNYGRCVDLFAPGVNIPSAFLNGGERVWSGTSMASPHVAGAAALYLQGHTGASPQQVWAALFDRSTKCAVNDARSTNWHLLYARSDSDPWDCGDDPTAPDYDAPLVAATDLACVPYNITLWIGCDWTNPNPHADKFEIQWRPVGGAWSSEIQESYGQPLTKWVPVDDGNTVYELRVRHGSPDGRWADWSNTATATSCPAKGNSGKCK